MALNFNGKKEQLLKDGLGMGYACYLQGLSNKESIAVFVEMSTLLYGEEEEDMCLLCAFIAYYGFTGVSYETASDDTKTYIYRQSLIELLEHLANKLINLSNGFDDNRADGTDN
jgi:hypothetical protein